MGQDGGTEPGVQSQVLFVACPLSDVWEAQWKPQVGGWMCVSLTLKMRLELLGLKESLLSPPLQRETFG